LLVYNTYLISEEKVNEEILEEIIKNYKSGFNQFIIVNTVRRSQEIYNALRNKIDGSSNILLLHSEFVWEDKQRKEKKLIEFKETGKRPLILVSTQVIEVSLDISCEKMYTELAPADALGQRGGRLNRGGKVPDGAVMKVFLPEEILHNETKKRPYSIDLLEKTLKLLKNKEYSYDEIKKICDEVYVGLNLDQTCLIKFFEECCLFGYHPNEIAYGEEKGKLLKIREESFKKIEVIPLDIVKEKVSSFCKKKEIQEEIDGIFSVQALYKRLKSLLGDDLDRLRRRIFSVRNEGKISFFVYRKKSELFEFVELKNRFYAFTVIPYSRETGFDYKKALKEVEVESNII